jgi:hypothetical protein
VIERDETAGLEIGHEEAVLVVLTRVPHVRRAVEADEDARRIAGGNGR